MYLKCLSSSNTKVYKITAQCILTCCSVLAALTRAVVPGSSKGFFTTVGFSLLLDIVAFKLAKRIRMTWIEGRTIDYNSIIFSESSTPLKLSRTGRYVDSFFVCREWNTWLEKDTKCCVSITLCMISTNCGIVKLTTFHRFYALTIHSVILIFYNWFMPFTTDRKKIKNMLL